jgi:hypothetical protein
VRLRSRIPSRQWRRYLLNVIAAILLFQLILILVLLARSSDGLKEVRDRLEGLAGLEEVVRGQDRQLADLLRRYETLETIPRQAARLDEVHTGVQDLRQRLDRLTPVPAAVQSPPPPVPPAPALADNSDLLVVVVNSKNLAITDFQDVFSDFFGGQPVPGGRRMGFYVAEGATLATRLDVQTSKRNPAGFFIARPTPDTTERLDEIGPLLAEKLDKTRPSRCLLVASSRCRVPSASAAGWKQLAGLDVILISNGPSSGTEAEDLLRWVELCSLKDGLFCHLPIPAAGGGAAPNFRRALESQLGRLTSPVLKRR